jgi:hypothetical protein
MPQESFVRLRDWVEPAHPSIVDRFADLVAIYTHIRDHFQKGIDAAFDRVARQIGFVVTTTIPVMLEIGEGGAFRSINAGAEHLKGTLFEKELLVALNPQPLPPKSDAWKASTGKYNLYVIWHAALKLKLRTDWMEPAHLRQFAGGVQASLGELSAAGTQEVLARVRWDVREPAHWFNPGLAISVEEAVLIEAIDQVYPDLHLVERVSFYRQSLGRVVRPEVKEPAHFRQIEEILQTERGAGLAAELAALLRRFGY